MSKDILRAKLKDGTKVRHGQSKNEVLKEFNKEEEQRPHTITIRPSLLERIRDYVYHMKLNGDPYYTQGDAIEQAVILLFENSENIPERPEEAKKKENRGRRRKQRTNSSPANKSKNPSNDPFT